MTPREMRLLKCLASSDKVFVRELRSLIGALNPAQNAMSLRKQGWRIHTGYVVVHDRDDVPCRPGFYWMEASEQARAQEFLEKTDRAAATAPTARRHFNDKISDLDCSTGGENDNLL